MMQPGPQATRALAPGVCGESYFFFFLLFGAAALEAFGFDFFILLSCGGSFL